MATSEELLDIRDIPYFPYVPGLLQWCSFLVFAALVIISLIFISKRKKQRRNSQAIDLCQEEIDSLTVYLQQHPEQSKDLLSRASLLTRRFISSLTNEDISNFSPAELENFNTLCSSKELAELIRSISDSESYKYSPENDSQLALEYLRKISSSLKDYKNYMAEDKQ